MTFSIQRYQKQTTKPCKVHKTHQLFKIDQVIVKGLVAFVNECDI